MGGVGAGGGRGLESFNVGFYGTNSALRKIQC